MLLCGKRSITFGSLARVLSIGIGYMFSFLIRLCEMSLNLQSMCYLNLVKLQLEIVFEFNIHTPEFGWEKDFALAFVFECGLITRGDHNER